MLVLGLFYKLVLADNLGAFELRDELHNGYAIWLTNLLFGLRIYFDFAGYSFIALGLAKAFGVELTLNFRAPYASASIREFWQRWHITLSTWFRDYVYLPLGGSRHGSWVFNIAVVFLVSGLWHGAGVNFILWGALHAVLMILGGWAGRIGWRIPHLFSRPATLLVVCFSWLLFYETSFAALGTKTRALLAPASYHPRQLSALISTSYPQGDRVPLAFIVALALVVLVLEFRRRSLPNPYETLLNWRSSCVLSLALVLFAHHGDSPFIYFAF
jgi:D-alanyl-lipoteichoic acid acyltransferase DltB (MBOAT superfamily)